MCQWAQGERPLGTKVYRCPVLPILLDLLLAPAAVIILGCIAAGALILRLRRGYMIRNTNNQEQYSLLAVARFLPAGPGPLHHR